ncbi:Protein of unknown function (DUF1005 [Striga hermonthica]|uniref:Formin-like protein 18 n=1 Tax=Striga hermonthica TaxID=68872 RepID=A0A9N7RGS3_STRHE|nr:Protein of unknown function (DUF1005 [Striga hermonthica]
MDPCPFVRLIVESLSLKIPSAAGPAGSGVHPAATPCYAQIKLKKFPSQTALVPLPLAAPSESPSAAGFHLGPDALRTLSSVALKISVFTGRTGRTCGITRGKPMGSVRVRVDLGQAQTRPAVCQNGWLKLGGDGAAAALHVKVRSEPDPRFVFQFGGEPEVSPVVFQIQGNIRQPVFSCKFSADRNNRSRSLPSDFNASSSSSATRLGWLRRTLSSDRDGPVGPRKGWMVTVHDLSGSAVAAASMITPFVPSRGSHRVSRSSPGAWLVLRPSPFGWEPWGRLEAWRERGDALGYRFELAGSPVSEGTISARKGGRFCIGGGGSFGFVMGSSVGGEGGAGGPPGVEVGARHVGEAALFVALSAAADLSMEACRPFSGKLRREFGGDEHESFFA